MTRRSSIGCGSGACTAYTGCLLGRPAEKVIVELDSWEFHKNRIAFETDRERDAETLAHGFITVRMTWERIHVQPDREGSRLRAIVEGRRGPAAQQLQAPSAA